MRNHRLFLVGPACLVVLLSCPARADAQADRKGCQDHPALSRMANYYVLECLQSQFDAHEFLDPDAQGKKTVSIEGKLLKLTYRIKEDAVQPSMLQIRRNYMNAVKQAGGVSVELGSRVCARFAKGGVEIWADLESYSGAFYTLFIVERGEMVQEVTANAAGMANDIKATGKTALYGIYFDFDKADVKPESEPALKEIATLLVNDPKLRLYVVGHTDNAGAFDYNVKLSQQRADAVVKRLVSAFGVAQDRLKGFGVGPVSPVASNDTDEGKARNRRVELVKQ